MNERTPDLAALHARLRTRLASWFRRRAPSDLDHEDLVQDVFVRLHRQLSQLRSPGAAEAVAWRTARSVLVDALRRRRPSHALDEAVPGEEPTGDPGTEWVATWLPAFVEALEEPYRTAVRRVDLDGISQAALAKELGLSLSGARSRVQRGRQRLRDLVLACCEVRFEDGEVMDVRARDCEPLMGCVES